MVGILIWLIISLLFILTWGGKCLGSSHPCFLRLWGVSLRISLSDFPIIPEDNQCCAHGFWDNPIPFLLRSILVCSLSTGWATFDSRRRSPESRFCSTAHHAQTKSCCHGKDSFAFPVRRDSACKLEFGTDWTKAISPQYMDPNRILTHLFRNSK